MNMKQSSTVKEIDCAGNKSFISVSKENSKIHIYSPEDMSDVIFTTKQAKELVNAIEKCIKS